MDIRSLLSLPATYRFFTYLIGAKKGRLIYVRDYVKPKPGDKVLDIGCGPAEILEYMPGVDYTGFDVSEDYINDAKMRFGGKGVFFCKEVSPDAITDIAKFDIVLATGVLHHLNDGEALDLLRLAKKALKSSGRLITLDNCYVQGQSRIARYLISKDRGHFVRTRDGYASLARQVFGKVAAECRSDLLRIPYTNIILVCEG